jgi:hypothetical protein
MEKQQLLRTQSFQETARAHLGILYEKYYDTLKTKGASTKRSPSTEKSLHDSQAWYDRFLKKWADRKLDAVRLESVRELHKKITDDNGPIIANRVVGLPLRLHARTTKSGDAISTNMASSCAMANVSASQVWAHGIASALDSSFVSDAATGCRPPRGLGTFLLTSSSFLFGSMSVMGMFRQFKTRPGLLLKP